MKEQKTSRYFGVFFAGDTKPHPWVVRYRPEGTSAADSPYLGNWQTERDAAIAYDRAALFFGDKPRNFPGKKLEPADPKQLQWLAHQPIKEAQTSKFLGVSWATQSEKWIAGIGHDRKHHFLGSYDNEEDAARARDSAAIRLCDLPVKLNFQPVTGKPLYGEMYDGPIPANFGVRQRKKKKTVAR
ncbi:MAG: hypothetical protein SGI86_11915 [Deltaproteobacteria bacterium]|nr:hypothetical protein [Deltaproteobacteria bacterium]